MLVPMKKATLYALKDDREAILLNLQRDGNLMLITTSDGNSLPGLTDVDSALEKTQGSTSDEAPAESPSEVADSDKS